MGKGGFGEVYKAEFRGQAVAVKVFSSKAAAINNTTPNHLIRQEVCNTTTKIASIIPYTAHVSA